MELLMNELVGRSIAQERERDLALDLRRRSAAPRSARRPWRSGPPRPRRRVAPVPAHA